MQSNTRNFVKNSIWHRIVKRVLHGNHRRRSLYKVTGKVGLSTTEAYLHSESIIQPGTFSKVYVVYVAQEGQFFFTVSKYQNTETNFNT